MRVISPRTGEPDFGSPLGLCCQFRWLCVKVCSTVGGFSDGGRDCAVTAASRTCALVFLSIVVYFISPWLGVPERRGAPTPPKWGKGAFLYSTINLVSSPRALAGTPTRIVIGSKTPPLPLHSSTTHRHPMPILMTSSSLPGLFRMKSLEKPHYVPWDLETFPLGWLERGQGPPLK